MSKVYEVIASNGEYQDREGNTKTRWLRCGFIIKNPQSGKMSLKLDTVPVSPEWSGWFSLTEPKPYPSERNNQNKAPQNNNASPPAGDFPDEDIPF